MVIKSATFRVDERVRAFARTAAAANVREGFAVPGSSANVKEGFAVPGSSERRRTRRAKSLSVRSQN